MNLPHDVEFHREGVGLLPEAEDPDPGLALWVPGDRSGKGEVRACSCKGAKKRACAHQRRLAKVAKTLEENEERAARRFTRSVWYGLAEVLFGDGRGPMVADVRVGLAGTRAARAFRVQGPEGEELLRSFRTGDDGARFLGRLGRDPAGDRAADRAALLERLRLCQLSETERAMNARGYDTVGQRFEKSFWYRIAYHGFRELGDDGRFQPRVDESSGDFCLVHAVPDGSETMRIVVPRERVEAVLAFLRSRFPDEPDLAVRPLPLRTLFRVRATTDVDVEIRPVIEAMQVGGERQFLESDELEKFRYGRLVWVRKLGILAELEPDDVARKFVVPERLQLKRHELPGFLEEVEESLGPDAVVPGGAVEGLRVFRDCDSLEIAPGEADGDAWRVSVRLGFGDAKVDLGEILEARKREAPYLDTESGWVKLDSPVFARAESALAGPSAVRVKPEGMWLTALDLFRLRAVTDRPVTIREGKQPASRLRDLLELRPAHGFRQPRDLACDLRDYQKRGVEWLHFLAENRLSGLLCDDMGLGKTHQSMALMCRLREQGETAPFLVVCPLTVISHWRDKIARFAPALGAAVHHGRERSLDETLAEAAVVITSYGVLRNDVEEFTRHRFSLVVFDEAQQIKNRETQTYEAARRVDARMRLGLSGTPIENHRGDLEALLDLVLPGYLEGAGRLACDDDVAATVHLRRLAFPFVLRRLKSAVLDELPEKIEDIRTAALSEEQRRLYRDAVAARGEALAHEISQRDRPVPYIHVFALLDHLKQICNHPALALRTPEAAGRYESGKWDLFQELLFESLEAGRKIVVFTQYLGMISMMEDLLNGLGIGFVALTGSTPDRGRVVASFESDPDCRVFLGSLKAGGTGIDLVAGSVVIHYDRWWNAAREDQATDRVHRIGQRRSVQVFKLLTEGTLEERIHELIERKRDLLDRVVSPDDPALLKSFTREELLSLLVPA